MSKTNEWDEFGFRKSGGEPLRTIAHVTHTDNAVSILREGVMRPQLIYDKSKLNTSRILVNWLSPNFWGNGSRYGNVCFEFDWKRLLGNKKAYWIEKIDYKVVACRFLLTDKDYTKNPLLVPYDPTKVGGPWWHEKATDTHYWNPGICLEIMVEDEIDVHDCLRTTFVDHHRDFCCIDPGNCSDKGKLGVMHAAPRFLAGVVGLGLPTASLHLTENVHGSLVPRDELRGAHTFLHNELPEPTGTGTVKAKDGAAAPLARALLAAFYRKDTNDQEGLASLFASQKDLLTSVDKLVCAEFGLSKI